VVHVEPVAPGARVGFALKSHRSTELWHGVALCRGRRGAGNAIHARGADWARWDSHLLKPCMAWIVRSGNHSAPAVRISSAF